jgi:thiol-disulfide isomerase/thioredoxin
MGKLKKSSNRFLLKYFAIIIVFPFLILSSCSKQKSIEIKLLPQPVQKEQGPRWSPKGKKLVLTQKNDGLETQLNLGNNPVNNWAIRMTRTGGSEYYNTLFVDYNQNEKFEDSEMITTQPSESRNKIWSSFSAEVDVAATDPWTGEAVKNTYPLSFWYVFDPREDTEEEVIRFSRKSWFEGSVTIDGIETNILLTEGLMDGKIDTSDYWAISPKADLRGLYDYRNSRQITKHSWLNEKAYRIVEVHPSGRRVIIEAFDPGMTRLEEAEKMDIYAADKKAAHSGGAVIFEHDFAIAEQKAKTENKNLFIDFEATWCGPCKLMDKIVYNADAVVKASANIIAVKVDCDEHPELVKRFGIKGYPTLILISPKGEILKTKSGYQSVKRTVAFLETKK